MCIEVTRVKVTPIPNAGRLRAICEIVIDEAFIIKEVKIIETKSGNIVRLPEKELIVKCPLCQFSVSMRARFCPACGTRLPESDKPRWSVEKGLSCSFYSVAVPITSQCREHITQRVLEAYQSEVAHCQPQRVFVRGEQVSHQQV